MIQVIESIKISSSASKKQGKQISQENASELRREQKKAKDKIPSVCLTPEG